FARCRSRQSPAIRPCVGNLQEVIVTDLRDSENLLNLRLSLEQKILRASAANDNRGVQSSLAAMSARTQYDRRSLVDVDRRIDLQSVAAHRQAGDIHPNRAVAGRRSKNRYACAKCSGQHTGSAQADAVLILRGVAADSI